MIGDVIQHDEKVYFLDPDDWYTLIVKNEHGDCISVWWKDLDPVQASMIHCLHSLRRADEQVRPARVA